MGSVNKSSQTQTTSLRSEAELISLGFRDPVIQSYKEGVDRTLLRENLKLSVQERFEKFAQFMKYVEELGRTHNQSRKAGVVHGSKL
ncbi:MAG: hypothetical protein HY711_00405 [Candidatus Melainabacteria bacterium]|nr:hypothetical protein [Candidatus Melainabacteria bacterium]